METLAMKKKRKEAPDTRLYDDHRERCYERVSEMYGNPVPIVGKIVGKVNTVF